VAILDFLGMTTIIIITTTTTSTTTTTTTTATTGQHFMHEILKPDKFLGIPAAILYRNFSSCLLSKIIRIEMYKHL